MDENFLSDLKISIQYFNDSLRAHIPVIETEVNTLIKAESKDRREIENALEVLLSLSVHGVGNDLFVTLLEYYKTVDPEDAALYWNEYDHRDKTIL